VPGGFPLVTAAADRAIVTISDRAIGKSPNTPATTAIPIDVSRLASRISPLRRACRRCTFAARPGADAHLLSGLSRQGDAGAERHPLSGNATITAIADTSGMGVGMPVEGTGIASSCTIASLVANTSITLNSGACVTASGTSLVTVFLTGYGIRRIGDHGRRS
jgi:hypothetical protein